MVTKMEVRSGMHELPQTLHIRSDNNLRSSSSATGVTTTTSSTCSSNGTTVTSREERMERLHCMLHPQSSEATEQDEGALDQYASRQDGGTIDLDQLRELVFKGIDDTDAAVASFPAPRRSQSIRPLAWRTLLGVLDVHPARWDSFVSEKRAKYRDWKREFLGCRRQRVVGEKPEHEANGATTTPKMDNTQDEDIALMKEIDKVRKSVYMLGSLALSDFTCCVRAADLLLNARWQDVSRTQSGLPFFMIGGIAQQWMLHILFLYAKLNPDLGYMQGMNEILAPIVFVYGTDPSDAWVQEAEADAFFSFAAIMASTKLLYTRSPLDPTKSGVDTQMTRLTLLLRQHDALLWQHLNSIGLTPDLYSFRWYMTLLTREFPMPATLRIWDSLLADPKRFSFLHYVSCALIRSQRARLLRDGFSGCLKTLQTLPNMDDIDNVLLLAEQMREKDRSIDQSRMRCAAT